MHHADLSALTDNVQGKIPLIQLLKQRYPNLLIPKRKRGFGIPIKDWIQSSMPEWLVDNSAAFILKDLDCIANKSFSTERNFEMTYRISVLNTWLDNFFE